MKSGYTVAVTYEGTMKRLISAVNKCLHAPVSHIVFLSAGSPHSLEETEAAGRETGKTNKYVCFPTSHSRPTAATSKLELGASSEKKSSLCFGAVV